LSRRNPEWRLGGLGSADAPIVMGESENMSVSDLWKIFTRRMPAPEANFPMRRGLAVEPLARRCYLEITGLETRRPPVAYHPTVPILRASLDAEHLTAYSGSEFKAPGIRDHSLALDCKISKGYVWQLVQQMAVKGWDQINYFSFYANKVIPPDFKPASFSSYEEIKEDYQPPEFQLWRDIDPRFIWRRRYLASLGQQRLIDFLKLSKWNVQTLTMRRDPLLEEFLIYAQMKFWEHVQRDIPPPEDFMKDEKPNLTLVPPAVEPAKARRESVFTPLELPFKVRKSRPTTKKEAMKILRERKREREKKGKTKMKKSQGPPTPVFSPKETVELLTRLKELGVAEFRFVGQEPMYPQEEAPQGEQEAPEGPEAPHIPPGEEYRYCECGAPKGRDRYGRYFEVCLDCYDRQGPARRPPPRRRPYYGGRGRGGYYRGGGGYGGGYRGGYR
jgi:hypothetical protein